MLSDANREIRTMNTLAEERRRRPSRNDILHPIDSLIDELEEFNLADFTEVPAEFFQELNQIRAWMPEGSVPTTWPTTINNLLDCCFHLQAKLLSTGPAVH